MKTISKLVWLLGLMFISVSSHTSDPTPWDELLLENQDSLSTAGYFVSADNQFYYLGFKSTQQDSLDAEFEFLLAFQDQVSDLLANLCEESHATLRDSYRFNVPFTKNMVDEPQGLMFVATVNKTALRQEARHACE